MNAPSEIAYLRHMRDALRAIKEYTITGRSGFFASKMVQDAVVRNLEVLGEATKALSAEVRGHAPHVPWRRIADKPGVCTGTRAFKAVRAA